MKLETGRKQADQLPPSPFFTQLKQKPLNALWGSSRVFGGIFADCCVTCERAVIGRKDQ